MLFPAPSDLFKSAKNDLIAELKLSHNVGGVSKLKSEQARIQEEEDNRKFRRFLETFTPENYLHKVGRTTRGPESSTDY